MTHTPYVFATATIEDGNTATIMANYLRKQEESESSFVTRKIGTLADEQLVELTSCFSRR